MTQGFKSVTTLESLEPGDMVSTESDGERVLVANVDGHIYAVSDECPNDGARLSDGLLRGNMLTCPEDGSVFQLDDGSSAPITGTSPRLGIFQTRIRGRVVEVGERLF